jgi:hypothetical protein
MRPNFGCSPQDVIRQNWWMAVNPGNVDNLPLR